MRSSRRLSLIAHLAALAAMAGLAGEDGAARRRSPKKNAPLIIRALPPTEGFVHYPRKAHLHDLCRRRLTGRAL